MVQATLVRLVASGAVAVLAGSAALFAPHASAGAAADLQGDDDDFAGAPYADAADTVYARELLASARGTAPLACALATRGLSNGGWGPGEAAYGTGQDVRAALRWAGRGRISDE